MNGTANVVLRDGSAAALTRLTEVPGFPLSGLRGNGCYELWNDKGRWREQGPDHKWDIVAIEHAGGLIPFKGIIEQQ